MHIFFHHRLFCFHPFPISACRLWMALWASHKHLSQLRYWRAGNKEYSDIKWISSCTVIKLFKVNIYTYLIFFWCFGKFSLHFGLQYKVWLRRFILIGVYWNTSNLLLEFEDKPHICLHTYIHTQSKSCSIYEYIYIHSQAYVHAYKDIYVSIYRRK